MKNILFAASECVPFVKTGGLADVIGALPKYLDTSKYDVRVILPYYKVIAEECKPQIKYKTHFFMDLNWRSQYVGVFEAVIDNITFYLIDNEFYFCGDKPYGNIYEDMEKFAFFCRAVLSSLPLLSFRPDLIHCNDWQTGLIPVYLHDTFWQDDFFRGIKTIMTIHNLKFQGVWDRDKVQDITGLASYYFTPDKLESYGEANYLKGGIVYADCVTTVSNTYASEIQSSFYGEGLDGLMRARSNSLCGIVNGIDYGEYNPQTDPFLVERYDATGFANAKRQNKLALQRELSLSENSDCFLIGIVSRLTDQKGLDLVECVIEELLEEDIQMVVLGTGDAKYENLFRHYEWKYRGRVSANICYSDERAHKIYAAADAFLMPSLFEPCGLSQLISLRYGTVPIVRETGGLKDTVVPYNEFEDTGTGFSFINYNAHEMLAMVRYAKRVFFENKPAWNRLVTRGMTTDYSWSTSAKEYEKLYQTILKP